MKLFLLIKRIYFCIKSLFRLCPSILFTAFLTGFCVLIVISVNIVIS